MSKSFFGFPSCATYQKLKNCKQQNIRMDCRIRSKSGWGCKVSFRLMKHIAWLERLLARQSIRRRSLQSPTAYRGHHLFIVVIVSRLFTLVVLLLLNGDTKVLTLLSKLATTISNGGPTKLRIHRRHTVIILHNNWLQEATTAGSKGRLQQQHGLSPHGGYDYYGGQDGHAIDASKLIHIHAPGPSPVMGQPPAQANYNYGQPQGPDYGQPAPYSQSSAPPPAQSYGHGASQPSLYPQGTAYPGYGPQEQYGKPLSYGMPPQGAHAQSYGQPRATESGNVPYQGPFSSAQSYGQTASAQQSYPYASSGHMQQTYAPYGSTPSADGYNHPPPTVASAPGYPQQGGQPVSEYGQPVSGYGQPGGQQAPGYAQVGPTGGYAQYPASQTGYTEQVALNNAAYGYQVADDPAYSGGPGAAYGAPPSGQPTYSQPVPTQLGYDQSIPQSGGYATAPAGYVKSVSPQPGYPQYDASQMYGARR